MNGRQVDTFLAIAKEFPLAGALIVMCVVFIRYLQTRDKQNHAAFAEQAAANRVLLEQITTKFAEEMRAMGETYSRRADECHAIQERSLDLMSKNTEVSTRLEVAIVSLERKVQDGC